MRFIISTTLFAFILMISLTANAVVVSTKPIPQNAIQKREALDAKKAALKKHAPKQFAAKKEKLAVKAMPMRYRLMNQNGDVVKGKWNWNKWLYVGGMINADASYWTKPYFGVGPLGTSGTYYWDLSTANVNIDIKANSWINAHVGLLYMNGKSPAVQNFRPAKKGNRRVNEEEAYLDIHNFSQSPYFLRAGDMFLPFGRYQRYPMIQTLTQVLSQTNLPGVQLGFLSKMGIEGSVYVVKGDREIGQPSGENESDSGFNLGYANYNRPTSFDVGVGYIRNMADTDAIRAVIDDNKGYGREVPGWSLYGDIYMGPFSYSARYVTAARRFNPHDFQYTKRFKTEGATPSAVDVSAGYSFKSFKHSSRLTLSYQWTYEANNTAINASPDGATHLPKHRWLVAYGVNLVRNLALQLQFFQDQDYPHKNGGTNKKDSVTMLRLSYIF